jgi:site-specific DNA-cytosine methylase
MKAINIYNFNKHIYYICLFYVACQLLPIKDFGVPSIRQYVIVIKMQFILL